MFEYGTLLPVGPSTHSRRRPCSGSEGPSLPAVMWRWSHNEIGEVTNKWPEIEAGPLLVWALWTTDSLDYLERVDDQAFGRPQVNRALFAHHPDVIDIAHVRWACGSAVTAIDLCAGVLGRRYCGATGAREMAFSWFTGKNAAKWRGMLPQHADEWVGGVRADPSFDMLKAGRDPLTHGRLNRTLQASTVPAGPHQQRTTFHLPNADLIDARAVVTVARSTTERHVAAFLDGVMTGKY